MRRPLPPVQQRHDDHARLEVVRRRGCRRARRARCCRAACSTLAVPSRRSCRACTGPPWKPSSVTSVQRTAGVHSDFIQARSTPGVRNRSSLMLLAARRGSGRRRCRPASFSTTMRSVLPMPRRSLRCSAGSSGCRDDPCGIILSKLALSDSSGGEEAAAPAWRPGRRSASPRGGD